MTAKPLMVNLWAGPGAGKSATASALFVLLKMALVKAELVTEFAKVLTYTGRRDELRDQLWVSACQEHQCRILIGQVDVIVSDSPTGLGGAYVKTSWKERDLVAAFARYSRAFYNNIDIWIDRDLSKPFQAYGRRERTVEEAILKDEQVREVMLHTTSAGYTQSIQAGPRAAVIIKDIVMGNLNRAGTPT